MPGREPFPRWVPGLMGLVAIWLVPWTLYLTFTLPSRHLTEHYDLAWVGFDIGLAAAFAATAWAAYRALRWLGPLAAVTGTMLLCDAWFDIVTSQRSEVTEAVVLAIIGELPLAALCAYIVVDVERFLATVDRFRPRPLTPAARRAALRAMSDDARAERRAAPTRPDRRA